MDDPEVEVGPRQRRDQSPLERGAFGVGEGFEPGDPQRKGTGGGCGRIHRIRHVLRQLIALAFRLFDRQPLRFRKLALGFGTGSGRAQRCRELIAHGSTPHVGAWSVPSASRRVKGASQRGDRIGGPSHGELGTSQIQPGVVRWRRLAHGALEERHRFLMTARFHQDHAEAQCGQRIAGRDLQLLSELSNCLVEANDSFFEDRAGAQIVVSATHAWVHLQRCVQSLSRAVVVPGNRDTSAR